MDNSVELLSTFQLFYHKNGRLPLANGLIIVPDGDVSEGEEKINFKNLYEMIRHTKISWTCFYPISRRSFHIFWY